MTHDTPPKRIWMPASGEGPWFIKPVQPSNEYILASEAEAMVAAALREAAEPLLKMRKGIEADVLSAHQNRGNGASEWMREDDRDFRRDLTTAFDTLALIPQPAAAALDKLIAEAEARGMERAAQIGGDAAVEVLLRHEPDAGPLKIQMTRQTIANPIRRAAKGEPT